MDTVTGEIERDASGRFMPGRSGNPAGKKPGTLNRKTMMLEALRDGEGVAACRVVIEKAIAGDAVAARFVAALISPKPRGRTIQLDMPADDDCNVVTAFNVTLRALCQGEITPDEALTVGRFLDGRRKTLQAWQLEEKLTSYGRTIPGDPEWAEEKDGDEDDEDAAEAEMTEPEAVALAIHQARLAARAAATPAAPEPTGQPQPSSNAAPLQSACISRPAATTRDLIARPADEFDAADATDAASVAQRQCAPVFAG